MTMMQGAMKKGSTEELNHSTFTNIHGNVHNHAQRQYLKLQKMKKRLASMSFDGNIIQPLCYPC